MVDAAGHPKIDRSQLRWFRDYEWRPPQVVLTPVLATSSTHTAYRCSRHHPPQSAL